jgi:hypothetical protein
MCVPDLVQFYHVICHCDLMIRDAVTLKPEVKGKILF